LLLSALRHFDNLLRGVYALTQHENNWGDVVCSGKKLLKS
jgi:hypothetical protein